MQTGRVELISVGDVLEIKITPELGTTSLGLGDITDSGGEIDDGYNEQHSGNFGELSGSGP